jgi:hypothetical protein
MGLLLLLSFLPLLFPPIESLYDDVGVTSGYYPTRLAPFLFTLNF